MNIHDFTTPYELAQKAVQQILKCAADAIRQRQSFHCVLAGGTTPGLIYTLLKSEQADWSKWHLYLGDERILPANDPERNSIMIENSWLKHIQPDVNWYPIPVEKGIDNAAQSYADIILKVNQFDLVLLGMGEDGHTASLFPHLTPADNQTIIKVYDSPKPPSQRLSLSKESLANCRQLLFIVTGEGKKSAVEKWFNGEKLPIQQVQTYAEKKAVVELYIDAAALAENKPNN